MDAAKKYEYIKTLGEGSYGHVWLCRDRERDCLVAIKKFKDANKDSQAYHLAMREIKLLRATSHEHVVSVIEAFRSQSSGNVYLVMEYAESCLNLELKKHRTGLPTADVMRITWQLASALQYLHSRKTVHRDLKPANILLTASGDLKLCDFGFARDLPPAGQQADMSSYVTTRWYRAPEVVVGAEYGAAVDIWALGCLFAELLNGQPLFPGASNMDQLALIVACFGHLPNRLLAKALTNPQLVGVQLRTGNPRNWAVALQQRFAPYGESAVSLLLSCLNPDPLKRATAEEVLRAPYFEPIRQKKVPSLNGPPTIAIVVTTAAPASTVTSAPAAPAGPVHPATVVPAPAAATATQTPAAPVDATIAKPTPQLQQPQQQSAPVVQPQVQPQQPPAAVTLPPSEGARLAKEMEVQPERPAPAVTVHAAPVAALSVGISAVEACSAQAPAPVPAGASGSAAQDQHQASRLGPVHPALAMMPRQALGAGFSVREAEQEAGAAAGAAGVRASDTEAEVPLAVSAPANATAVQRQTSQVRFLPHPLSFLGQSQVLAQGHGEQAVGSAVARPSAVVVTGPAAGATQENSTGEPARQLQPPHSQTQMQQHQQMDARVAPASFSHMRASMAAIPYPVSMGARPLTDTGMGALGTAQGAAPVAQGKAGATLVQHNKRASEHSIGMYGNHRGSGSSGSGPSDMPMRLARVSLVNPNIDAAQLAAENALASSSPSTTPTGGAAGAVAGTAAAAASVVSPSGSLAFGAAVGLTNGNGGAVQFAGGNGRRRSTATNSRLTRVSRTYEGHDPQQRDEDSEDDGNSELLSLAGGQGAAGNAGSGSSAPMGIVVGSGPQPSPRRRHSRLASVTEPGGQYPPSFIAASGGSSAAAASGAAVATAATGMISSSATDGGSFDHVASAPNRGPSAPQMLIPLGRSTNHLGHHGGISTGSGTGQGPTQGSVLLVSDSGHHGPAAHHTQIHSAMSALSLNVTGIGAAAARDRDREREREGVAEACGTLRSNAVVGIATPAAPTASQRSFTSQGLTTSAAAGLMSRPVSNLYINLEHHLGGGSGASSSRTGPHEPAESNSTDSSAAGSPSTPTGGGGSAAPIPSAAAAAAAPPSRRTTFTDGPSSMFKSVLRTLGTRRSTTSSHAGTGIEQQGSAAATAAAAPSGLQPANSIGGAPSAPNHGLLSAACGAAHSQSSVSSGGVSSFIPSRASSHNFITGAPPERVSVDVISSLSVPGATDDYNGTAAAAAALRRSVTVTHGVSNGINSLGGVGIGASAGGSSGARIGLPHLNVRAPEATAGSSGASSAGANGYGSAVVSPAGRRRPQLAAQPTRTSDAGIAMGPAGLRQTSTGSAGVPASHQGCKPATSLHGDAVAGVSGLVGGGGAALPVVRNPVPPTTEAPATRLTTGKGPGSHAP